MTTTSRYQEGFDQGHGQGYQRGYDQGRTDAQERKRSKGSWLVLKVLGGLLGLVVAFFTGVAGSDQTKNNLCDTLSPGLAKVANLTCAKSHQPVTQAEAESVIDLFLGMASGSNPARAWYLLSPAAQKQYGDLDKFQASYQNVLWFERHGAIIRDTKAGSTNRFSATFYAFTGPDAEHPDLTVNEYRQAFQLSHSGTTTKIIDLAPSTRPNTYEDWPIPRVHTASVDDYPGKIRGYGSPTLVNPADGGDPKILHGGLLRPFCKLQGPDGVWIYTTLGWLPENYLDGGTRDLGEMVFCDKHLVVTAQPLPPVPSDSP